MKIQRPLLSIAIPTWNRAESLEKALNSLLPQARTCGACLEVIVSDNCSTDHTQQVIRQALTQYDDLDIVTFRQESNTGFYGNFRKCKELATGSFLWLLSDDDYIRDGVLQNLVEFLKNSDDVSLVFLESVWSKENKPLGFSKPRPVGDLLREQSYHLTLISVAIFANVEITEEVFDRYKGSDFLGFVLLLSSLEPTDRAVSFYGDTLSANNHKHVGFNWFKAFGRDLPEAAELMSTVGLSNKDIRRFKRDVLIDLIRHYLILYKANRKLPGQYKYSSMLRIATTITCHYADTPEFFLKIVPLLLTPDIMVRWIKALKERKHKPT